MAKAQPKFKIEVLEQGFEAFYSKDEAKQFFEAEQTFLNSISTLLQEQLQWESRSYPNPNLHNTASQELREIRRHFDAGDPKPLDGYLAAARRLEVVLGQGTIGRRVAELQSSGKRNEARWLYYLFSPKWTGGPLNDVLVPIRAAIIGNPMFAAFNDVVSASQAVRVAQEARDQSAANTEKLEAFVAEKSKVISELEELFRKKIPVEESATYWQQQAEAKTTEWAWWLAAFGLMTLTPLIVGLIWWEGIAGAITRVTSANGTISVGGVAAVTVPALLYGWLLKNISRIFVQRMMLADDAAHRRLLTMTYLGLAKEPRLAITDNDRALILNALFRPVAPHAVDDGPPTGLIDLIRK